MKRLAIGLFGGTFNPIHFGHINLALELKEKKALDEVWFIPSLLSPLRTHESLLFSMPHRLEMLRLALESIPEFKVCTLELERPPPSYTIDTIKEILGEHPEHLFHLLLGEDTLIRFQEWKEPLTIMNSLPVLIGSRPRSELIQRLSTLGLNEKIVSIIQDGLVSIRQLDISGAEIRERLKEKLYCGHLLPSKVLDYIYTNQLYFNALT